MKIFICLIAALGITSGYSYDTVIGHPPNAEILERAKAVLPENPVILEAGSYDGADTLELSALLPKGKIYTLEPVPELYEKTRKNLVNCSNVNVYNYALSGKSGPAKMYLSEEGYAPGVVSMSSSLLPPKEHLKYSDTLFKKETVVDAITIDDWARQNGVQEISMLKLDIQGNELNVMMASPKIMENVKVILTEVEFVEAYEGQYMFEDIKNWLEARGFELNCLYMNGAGWFGDALFIRK